MPETRVIPGGAEASVSAGRRSGGGCVAAWVRSSLRQLLLAALGRRLGHHGGSLFLLPQVSGFCGSSPLDGRQYGARRTHLPGPAHVAGPRGPARVHHSSTSLFGGAL
ncbi:unnamed protein product [Boreogadus saida]